MKTQFEKGEVISRILNGIALAASVALMIPAANSLAGGSGGARAGPGASAPCALIKPPSALPTQASSAPAAIAAVFGALLAIPLLTLSVAMALHLGIAALLAALALTLVAGSSQMRRHATAGSSRPPLRTYLRSLVTWPVVGRRQLSVVRPW